MTKTILTKTEDKGKRLDKFLLEHLPEFSRSQIQKMIAAGKVTVNQKAAKVHQFLKPENQIEIFASSEKASNDKNEIKVSVIFENDDYLVLDKPSGILVHPTAAMENDTLTDWLGKYLPELKTVGEQNRFGLVHRLDKEVSGVMVIAKNNEMYYHLKNQFQNRTVKKIYWTLVYGHPSKLSDTIELPIGRNQKGQFVAHPVQKDQKLFDKDKVAKTSYRVIEYVKDYAVLEVILHTGRTHQIRIHLSAIGHPIVGDKIYQPNKPSIIAAKRKVKIIETPRIFLHAQQLSFATLKDETVSYEAPLPPALTEFINDQKKS